MATLIFPVSPTHLDTYVDPKQATWQYDSDGPYWNVITSTTRKNFSGAKIYNNIAYTLPQIISKVALQDVEFNIDNYFDATDDSKQGRITVPTTGFYRVAISFFTSSQGSGASYTFELRKNNLVINTTNLGPNQNTQYDQTLQLNAGDYIEVWGKESTGTGQILANSEFQVYRLGFTPGTGVSNHVAFSGVRAKLNAQANTTSTPVAVTWNEVDFNANANVLGDLYWYNTVANRLSIRTSGYFKCRCYVETSSAGSQDSYTIALRKTTGATPTTLTTINMSANDFVELDEVFYLVEDDYLELMISNSDNTGAIISTSYLELVREGV